MGTKNRYIPTGVVHDVDRLCPHYKMRVGDFGMFLKPLLPHCGARSTHTVVTLRVDFVMLSNSVKIIYPSDHPSSVVSVVRIDTKSSIFRKNRFVNHQSLIIQLPGTSAA